MALDQTVRLWNPASGAPVVTVLRRTIPVTVAMHNTQLAVADGEVVTLFEVMDGAG